MQYHAPVFRNAPEPAHEAAPIGFSLRFEAGRGIATLARPLAFELGQITRLVIDLGRLEGPIDLRAGTYRFRHRRARAVEVEAKLDLDACFRAISRDDLEIRMFGTSAETLSLLLRDPVRTIALDLLLAWDGRDLIGITRHVRAALEGPQSAIGAALSALRGCGADIDSELGVLRWADPLVDLLTDALVPHGWRVPELASTPRSTPRIEGQYLVLRTGSPDPLSERARSAVDDARVLAPILTALRSSEARALELARDLKARTRNSIEDLDPITADIALTLGSSPASTPKSPSLCLRAALQSGDLKQLIEAAHDLIASEPCDDVAIEGLRAASARLREVDRVSAAELSARALARRPRDGTLALEWLERASESPTPETLVDTLHSLLKTFVGPMRCAVLRRATVLLDRVGRAGEVLSAWEEICQLEPDDAAAHEGRARALEGASRHDDAWAAWDRAARLHSDADHAARALIHAALQAERAGHAAGAASRLESAVTRAHTDTLRAEARVELARIRYELDENLAANETHDASKLEALALRARATAESLRASGRLGEAALALAQAGTIVPDAATLRAALELAEKAGAWNEARTIVDLALSMVCDGPARGPLEARRAAIHARIAER